MLSAVARSLVTVTSLTFSLTVVTLQLAAVPRYGSGRPAPGSLPVPGHRNSRTEASAWSAQAT